MGAVCTGMIENITGDAGDDDGGSGKETFLLFSPDFYAAGRLKEGRDPLQKSWPPNGDTKNMVVEWGLSPDNPLEMRYATNGMGENLETMSRSLHGAVIEDPKSIHVCLVSFVPWVAPVAVKRAKMSGTSGKFVVFATGMTCVDIFVDIDGVPQTDGIMFQNDASMSNAAITKSPPPGAWCTIVHDQWNKRDDNALHLPLILNTDPTAACLNASHDYGGDFCTAFTQMVARAGSGQHEYTLRIAPRAHVTCDEDGIYNYSFCSKNSPDNSGFDKLDEETKEFCKNLDGHVVPSDPSNTKLTAKFKMTISDDTISNSLATAEKPAPEPIEAKEYADIVNSAKAFAGRVCPKATQVLGEDVSGDPAHFILSTSKDYGNDIGTARMGDKSRFREVLDFVYVYYVWKSPSNPDDGDKKGIMVRTRLERYHVKNFTKVGAPAWELAQVYSGDQIKNSQIDLAIQRDQGKY